jgi:hypothetical protein
MSDDNKDGPAVLKETPPLPTEPLGGEAALDAINDTYNSAMIDEAPEQPEPEKAEETTDAPGLVCPMCRIPRTTVHDIVPWRPASWAPTIAAHKLACTECVAKSNGQLQVVDGNTGTPLPPEKQPGGTPGVITADGDPNPMPHADERTDKKSIGQRLKDSLSPKPR